MATANPISEDWTECLECSICYEEFHLPKILPCAHTFCLACLEQIANRKRPGQTLPCPECRRECVIPEGGLSALQTNFFVVKLKDYAKPKGQKVIECSLADGDDASRHGPAVSKCVECGDDLCELCAKAHRVGNRITRNHTLVPIEQPVSWLPEMDSDLQKIPKNEKQAAISRKLEENILPIINAETEESVRKLEEIWKQNSENAIKIKQIEDGMTKTIDNAYKALAKEADRMRSSFKEAEQKATEELKIFTNSLQTHTAQLQSLKEECQRVIADGSVAAIGDVNVKALQEKLQQLQRADLQLPNVEVDSSISYFRAVNHNLGEITVSESPQSTAYSLQCEHSAEINCGEKFGGVFGIGILNEKLWLAGENKMMNIYTRQGSGWVKKKQFRIPEIECAVTYNNCVLMTSYGGTDVFRVEAVSGPQGVNYTVQTLKSPIAWSPAGISVTKDGSILIVDRNEKVLYKCSINGKDLNIISKSKLDPCVFKIPFFAVEANDGTVYLSDIGLNEVLVMSGSLAAGSLAITKRYTGAGTGKMLHQPLVVCLDSHGNLLVSEYGGNKVQLLDTATGRLDILLSGNNNIRSPQSIFLDEKKGYLYVGQQDGRTAIFKYNYAKSSPTKKAVEISAKLGQYHV